MSLPEVLLWQRLKGWRADGIHVRRQHPIGAYILDFYCDERRLAIEVDGAFHLEGTRPLYDARRDEWLKQQGIRVLRISAQLVMRDIELALNDIRQEFSD